MVLEHMAVKSGQMSAGDVIELVALHAFEMEMAMALAGFGQVFIAGTRAGVDGVLPQHAIRYEMIEETVDRRRPDGRAGFGQMTGNLLRPGWAVRYCSTCSFCLVL